jgi:hypothetical protein
VTIGFDGRAYRKYYNRGWTASGAGSLTGLWEAIGP